MKIKICQLCGCETRSGYYIDIMFITGSKKPIPACDICRDLLGAARQRLDDNKPVENTDQRIRLVYLLRVAIGCLESLIYQSKGQTNDRSTIASQSGKYYL